MHYVTHTHTHILHIYQKRLRDHIGPCSGTYGMGYRAVQPHLEWLWVKTRRPTGHDRRSGSCRSSLHGFSQSSRCHDPSPHLMYLNSKKSGSFTVWGIMRNDGQIYHWCLGNEAALRLRCGILSLVLRCSTKTQSVSVFDRFRIPVVWF